MERTERDLPMKYCQVDLLDRRNPKADGKGWKAVCLAGYDGTWRRSDQKPFPHIMSIVWRKGTM